MDSPLFQEFLSPASIPNFATMPTSHRSRHSSSTNHRSTSNDFPTMFRYRASSEITLSALLDAEEAAVAPAPSEGPSTRSRKRKHSESDQNPSPGSEAQNANPSQPHGLSTARPSRKRQRVLKGILKKPPPDSFAPGAEAAASAKVSGDDDDEDDVCEKKPAAVYNCCICMSDVEPLDLAYVNGCDHKFCFGCIEKWAERENSCPLCKKRFTRIDRVNKKKKKGTKNTKKVKQRDQRTDLGTSIAVQGMIASFAVRERLPDFLFGADIGRGRVLVGTAGAAGHFASRTTPPVVSALGSRDVDSDEESFGIPALSFFRTLRSGGFFAPPPIPAPVYGVGASPATSTARSYASNMDDNTAGSGADNPLEIDDSDEEVEVVQVTRP